MTVKLFRPFPGISLLFLAASLTRAFCVEQITPAAEPPSVRPPCCRPALTNSPPTERSLYQLDSVWTSDVGARVRLEAFAGRPQLIALFFTQCEFACPILVHDMKRLQSAMPESMRGAVDLLLVSLDSERDTPPVLAEFRKQHHLMPDHWTLLTGQPDDVRELAALLGVNYRKDGRGQFAHSNLLTVLNARGEIVHQQVGLNQDPAAAVDALVKAMK